MDTKGSSKKHPASYQIREFLLPVMENYKYGLLTEEAFCTTVKQYYDTNELSVHNDIVDVFKYHQRICLVILLLCKVCEEAASIAGVAGCADL